MIWSLQNLRLVAALMVVYLHAAQTAFGATGSHGFLPFELQLAGRAGVDIFFVLSGVVIAMSARGLTCDEFLWKRFKRVVPIYFLAAVPFVFIAAKTGFGWRDLLATFLLWPATDTMTAPLLPVAWTLCFEMLFYVAAALVLASRRWLWPLLALFFTCMALRSQGPLFQFLGNPIIFEFFFGVAIFHLPRKHRGAVWLLPLGALLTVWSGFAGLAPSGGTMEFLAGEEGFQRVLVYGLPAAMIVYGTMQIDAKESFWTYLGGASYVLYLTHVLPVSGLYRLWLAHPIAPEAIVLAGLVTSLLLAWRLHELFEKPILDYLGRYKDFAEAWAALRFALRRMLPKRARD